MRDLVLFLLTASVALFTWSSWQNRLADLPGQRQEQAWQLGRVDQIEGSRSLYLQGQFQKTLVDPELRTASREALLTRLAHPKVLVTHGLGSELAGRLFRDGEKLSLEFFDLGQGFVKVAHHWHRAGGAKLSEPPALKGAKEFKLTSVTSKPELSLEFDQGTAVAVLVDKKVKLFWLPTAKVDKLDEWNWNGEAFSEKS